MSPGTANPYLSELASIFEFATNERLIADNPAKNLRLPSDGIPASERRDAFTIAELNAIFSSLHYPKSGAKHWIPLIALFTGARLNELCQLRCADVTKVDGAARLNELRQLRCDDIARVGDVDVLFIRGKRLKTKSARRPIPTHPTLKKLGLLDYAATIRKRYGDSSALFPDLNPGTTGYLSDQFSKSFIDWLKSNRIHRRGVGIHALRHNFRDALREAALPVDVVKALGGWKRREVHDDYGSGLRIRTLAKAMAKVKYPGLELPSP